MPAQILEKLRFLSCLQVNQTTLLESGVVRTYAVAAAAVLSVEVSGKQHMNRMLCGTGSQRSKAEEKHAH